MIIFVVAVVMAVFGYVVVEAFGETCYFHHDSSVTDLRWHSGSCVGASSPSPKVAGVNWLVFTVAVWLVWRIVRRHHRRHHRRLVHSSAYDRLHSSTYWRKLRRWVFVYRARGGCERCGRRLPLAELELHCRHYQFLEDGTWPTPEDVQLLCIPCHNRADIERRAAA